MGTALFKRDFAPASVTGVAVCGSGNADLAWYCGDRGLESVIYENAERPERKVTASATRVEARRPPNAERKKKFMRGWEDAASGVLYDSVRTRKTHANMGNLFGWIFGEQSEGFREETWRHYVDSLPEGCSGRQNSV